MSSSVSSKITPFIGLDDIFNVNNYLHSLRKYNAQVGSYFFFAYLGSLLLK